MTTDARVRLVGIDGGLAAFGVAVAEVTATGLRFQRLDVWCTKPANKKRGLRKCDDTSERTRTLAGNLHQLVIEQRPVALAVEAVALPFGRSRSSVISALGRVRGVVDTLGEVHRLAILEETPQRLKQAVTGKANATKDEVSAALEALYPELAALWPAQESLREHAADACAAVHACRQDNVVIASLRAREAWPA